MTKTGHIRGVATSPPIPEAAEQAPNPESIERTPQSRPPTWVWVVLFLGAAVVLMVMLYRSGARQLSMGAFFIFPIMIMSMLMMLRTRSGADRSKRPAAVNQRRADFLRGLDKLRAKIHDGAAAQAREIAYHHPDPARGALLSLVGTARMWERIPKSRNFGHVRMGVGLTRLKTTLIPPDKVPPEEDRETVTAVAVRDFLLAQNVVHDVGRPLHLFDQMGWSVFAEDDQREIVQGLLRALVCQLCVFHGPDHVQVAIISDDESAWEWAKWLPHTADKEFVDASGEARLIFGDVTAFLDRFRADLDRRDQWSPRMEGHKEPDSWLVVVVDYPGANCAPIIGHGGHAGLSVLEATGDADSVLSTSATAFIVDEVGNLLRAEETI